MTAGRAAIRAVLVAAVVCELAVMLAFAVNSWGAERYLVKRGTAAPPLAGFGLGDLDGNRPLRIGAGCIAVRFASAKCRYCRLEEPIWERLGPLLGAKHCQVVIVSPTLSAAPYYVRAANHTPQFVWVTLKWARALRMFIMPTTVVVYRGRVAWLSQGAMGATAASSLRAFVARLPGAN